MSYETVITYLDKHDLPKKVLDKALRQAVESIEDGKIHHDEFCPKNGDPDLNCDCGCDTHNGRMDDNVMQLLSTLEAGSG